MKPMQRAMLAFLDAGERSWIDVVSVRGQLDTGFVIQSTGTIPHRAISALDELVSVGYATAGGIRRATRSRRSAVSSWRRSQRRSGRRGSRRRQRRTCSRRRHEAPPRRRLEHRDALRIRRRRRAGERRADGREHDRATRSAISARPIWSSRSTPISRASAARSIRRTRRTAPRHGAVDRRALSPGRRARLVVRGVGRASRLTTSSPRSPSRARDRAEVVVSSSDSDLLALTAKGVAKVAKPLGGRCPQVVRRQHRPAGRRRAGGSLL
jgi:hypothetical protein